ncbi:MAG: hypothetical protein QM599_07730 [Pseudoxanthomonas sp.]
MKPMQLVHARLRRLKPLALAGALLCIAACATSPSPQSALANLGAHAARAGATDLAEAGGPGGGKILNGKLDGRAFVFAVPANWTGETILFGQGYATPGTPPSVPADPIARDPGGGLMKHAYGEGVAIGIAASDKSGIATQSATENTLRLRTLAQRLGARRFYAVGGSMGGSIVMSLIEQQPDAFAGAVSMCGVTEGWRSLFAQMVDLRAAYNVLTAGTPLALPGEQDVTRSALPTVPPAGDATDGNAFREQQKMRLIAPVMGLFQAAAANPQGREARIVRQLSAISGFAADPAAIAVPLYAVSLGMDDMRETMGGLPIGNAGKVYAPPEMSAEEAADFNRRIQRFTADPAAVAYADRWHESTGRFRIPLVTVHQTIDALVPFSQSEGLGRAVAAAGNGARLAQYAVPPTRMPLPGGAQGYTHCGFTPKQNIDAFEAMRSWVKTGTRPGPDAVQ